MRNNLGRWKQGETRTMTRVFRLILPVSDIDAAARFYERILGVKGRRVSPGRHYLDCEGLILACYDPAADGDNRRSRPNPEPIYLAVDRLEQAHEDALAAGARLSEECEPGVGNLGEIELRPWGERSFYATDPFGNPLCFVSADTVFQG